MRRLVTALLFVTAGCVGQQAEVRPIVPVPTDELEVSPGLRPEDVQKAIDAAKPQLRLCMRLDLPDSDVPPLDDRVLLEFHVEKESKEPRRWSDDPHHVKVTRARSVFLDNNCLEDWAQLINLPQLEYIQRADVVWKSRWSTTAQERRAEKDRALRDLKAFCDEFNVHFEHALKVGFAGEPQPVIDAAIALLNRPDLSNQGKSMLEAMTSVNPGDHEALYESLAKDVGAPDCPNLAGYFTKIPENPPSPKP